MSRYDKITNNLDWGLLAIVAALIAVGLLCIYSAVRLTAINIFFKQLTWILVASIVMITAFLVDYRTHMRLAWPMYVCMVLLLAAVLVVGREISGARRWISLGFMSIQPSEFAKIIMIIWMAYWSEKKIQIESYGMKDLVVPALFICLPVGLILLEPDLGTAGIVGMIATIMILLIGVKRSTVITLGSLFVSALPFIWFTLREYQRNRILTFLDPSRDPLGTGYHAMQSKIAVGSGGLWGKGYLQGSQTQLSFLPEHHTDFIFSVVAEEWGFAGTTFLLLLYIILITKIIQVGSRAKDRFGSMICYGIAGYFSLHIFINISMTMGIFPVVGVPLPFISYGGSFMFMNLLCIGLVLNVAWRRFMF
ncbi:MAG TPA: rod shape-determining protein RodA [Deltaproteobacteria bacterium]|jgi:rod shape determining protein RodA|nr:rod shape-determining protein RodA [Deltaproteobacteria bacterium]HOI07719.1 rod shape-determining protein RodA [Deltaproteobacteria bacterium]